MPIRILLADRRSLFRAGLHALIAQESDLEVVGIAESGAELLDSAARLQCDVVCMDIKLPRVSGMEVAHRLRASGADIKIVALSEITDWRIVRDTVDAGAAAFVSKSSSCKELLTAIRTVMSGRRYFCQRATDAVMDAAFQQDGILPPRPSLTQREREVLGLIAQGHTLREISQALNLMLSTVRSYKTDLMLNLDLHCDAALTQYAMRHGITGAGTARRQIGAGRM